MTTSPTLAVGFALAWKSFAVMGAALIVARSLRRASAATRHLVWTLALAGTLALPVLVVLVPQRPVAVMPSTLAARWLPLPSWSEPRPADRDGRFEAAETTPAASTAAAPGVKATDVRPRPVESDAIPRRTLPMLVVLWIAGTVIVLARITIGHVLLRRSAHRAQPITSGPWRTLLRRLTSVVGLGTPPALLRLPNTAMPMTWGLMRPAVLLPDGADDWPDARREVVLLHELAHIRRRDCLTQALAQLACALYWFNPIVWIAARRVRTERELACDDLVLRHGATAPTYAAELLELARTLRDVRGGALATVAMARRSQLEGRLLAILNPSRNRATVSRPFSAALATAVFLVLLPIAVVVPVSGAVVPGEPEVSGSKMAWVPAVQAPSQARSSPTVRGPDSSQQPPPTSASPQAVPSAVEALVAALDDPDAQVRRTAAHALARLRDPRALPGLTAALKDESPDVRRAAASALGDLRDQQAVDALIGALKDPEPDVRRAAASALADLDDPRAVDSLIATIDDEAADVRRSVASALGDLGDTRAVSALIDALKDPNDDVRRAAASALGDLGDRSAVPALVAALTDESAEVRRFAASALGDIQDPAAAGPLANAMKDADPEVRRAAIAAFVDVVGSTAGSDPGVDRNPNPNPSPISNPNPNPNPASNPNPNPNAPPTIPDGIVGGIAGGITAGTSDDLGDGIVAGIQGGVPGRVESGVAGGPVEGVAGGGQAVVPSSDVRGHSVDLPWAFRGPSVGIPRAFRGPSVGLPRTFRGHSAGIPWTFRGPSVGLP